jgi:multiple RNA-binding domain-containing protein 1
MNRTRNNNNNNNNIQPKSSTTSLLPSQPPPNSKNVLGVISGGVGGVGGATGESSSTRLFIRNLPKHATDESLRKHFSKKGIVTDAKVLFKPDGKTPRQVGFVGFQSVKDAIEAQTYFNNTFMDTSKLIVEIAATKAEMELDNNKKKRKSATTSIVDKTTSESTLNNKRIKNSSNNSTKFEEFLSLVKPNSKQQQHQHQQRMIELEQQQPMINEDDTQNNNNSSSSTNDETTTTTTTSNNSRLFVRNLTYTVTEPELQSLFSRYGNISEIVLPKDETGRHSKGYCIVKYLDPNDANKALVALHEQAFQGRLLRIIPAEPERNTTTTSLSSSSNNNNNQSTKFSEDRHEKRRKQAGSSNDQKTWNSLFVRGEAASGAVAKELGVSKSELVLGGNNNEEEEGDDDDDVAVRVALTEIHVVNQAKEWLKSHGVNIDALGHLHETGIVKSDVTILVKNLPESTVESDLKSLFAKHGGLEMFIMPPMRTMALVKFSTPAQAKKAFTTLAYSRYKRTPLYLEWAPQDVLIPTSTTITTTTNNTALITTTSTSLSEQQHDSNDNSTSTTLFIKNLEFSVTEEILKQHILSTVPGSNNGELQHVSIPHRLGKKREILSQGFGFAQFVSNKSAKRALKRLHGSELLGHVMDVSLSEKSRSDIIVGNSNTRSNSSNNNNTTLPTKLVVRNLAFECTKKDVKTLFEAHGALRSVRLPKNYQGTLRGFAFVDFMSHHDAKIAFSALKDAHLYGRHLVIEWAQPDDDDE